MDEEKLLMTFEPNTIQHLGVKMYSNMPPALAELVANAYDACATEVHIRLYDLKEKKVEVEDNGIGMSFDEVNNYFLRIGRNRRDEEQKSPCGRIPTGKKGLGKLALFGIGETINIITSQGGKGVSFNLDWNEILKWKGKDYEPRFEILPEGKTTRGTKIILTNLKRKTGFPIDEYVEGLAKLFNFQDDFVVYLSLNDSKSIKIDNKLKYKNIASEFEWDFQQIVNEIDIEYSHSKEILGKIITTEKPLKANLRGISLFANGRLANLPEFFGLSESSHFFSYATGWLNVDFIDNFGEDVISTNRQSIDWENENTIDLKLFIASCLTYIEKKWREARKSKKKKEISEKVKLDVTDWIEKLPQRVQGQVDTFVNLLDDTPELSEAVQQQSVKILHELVPEYADYHWRFLQKEIQEASKADYENKDYYRAFIEAMKRYISETRKKSGSTESIDQRMLTTVFGRNAVLSVSKKFKKPNGTEFTPSTLENIEDGQKFLSMGILSGARNPLSHEEIADLKDSGLFSENDCLDFLSILSHLQKRLNDSEKIN